MTIFSKRTIVFSLRIEPYALNQPGVSPPSFDTNTRNEALGGWVSTIFVLSELDDFPESKLATYSKNNVMYVKSFYIHTKMAYIFYVKIANVIVLY
jgi:hypothetical protein